jgi:site-specific recombinase XerD
MESPLPELPGGRKSIKLPVVLDIQEIKTLLDAATTTKQRALISAAYSGGLRLSETSNLKITDIDSKRMMIRVSQGKGKKDRYTLLSQLALSHLREYYIQYRPQKWLFNGKPRSLQMPIGVRAIQTHFKTAMTRAGIQKKATFHSLRHSFATHLYENGTGLAHIKQLLGHVSLNTTMVYIHLAKGETAKLKSPLDNLLE